MILKWVLVQTSHKIINHPVYLLFLLQQVVLNHPLIFLTVSRETASFWPTLALQ